METQYKITIVLYDVTLVPTSIFVDSLQTAPPSPCSQELPCMGYECENPAPSTHTWRHGHGLPPSLFGG